MTKDKEIILACKNLIQAYETGLLGQTKMPEDSNPKFSSSERESRLAYFTLPMALNYQRDSYRLWEAALKTFKDEKTQFVFNISDVASRPEAEIREALMKYKLALQPNKHIHTWRTISKTVFDNWGSFEKFIDASSHDFLNLKTLVQKNHKKGFPYLSGPKIFNYWCFILGTYAHVNLKNKDQIDIAPDTHITQCSVKLGVIAPEEAESLSKEEISLRWKELLKGSQINPIDMHPPLWFWSRNRFIFEIKL